MPRAPQCPRYGCAYYLKATIITAAGRIMASGPRRRRACCRCSGHLSRPALSVAAAAVGVAVASRYQRRLGVAARRVSGAARCWCEHCRRHRECDAGLPAHLLYQLAAVGHLPLLVAPHPPCLSSCTHRWLFSCLYAPSYLFPLPIHHPVAMIYSLWLR